MPLITKPNYNQVFATQAPVEDQPAEFNNYPRGWDESRKNNGKPLISQFNFLQQTSDLKTLWILQNGACLPYDESIEYADKSLSLKDGIIQQLNNEVWSEYNRTKPYNLDYYKDGIQYPLHARIALSNGDIVQSTVENNTVDPNVDMTGWKKDKDISTSDVTSPSGLSQEDINQSSIHDIRYYGIKLDGSDETDAFLDIVESKDSGCIIISGGTLRLSKTARFASSFPKNDQPCVPLINKKNLVIFITGDAKVVTDKHAQGIFEMIRCENTHIMGAGEIIGAGNFPPLDGTTGRGEKGTDTGGYRTAGFWGYYKNNSADTSADNRGGFGGAFPQFGGGTASTWGTWNGGFIGNQGIGVLMHDGCVGCSVSGGLTISNFNGGGVQIGWNGDYFPTITDAQECVSCSVTGCTITKIYNAATSLNASRLGNVFNNIITDIGHPNALNTDQDCDPGYGVTCTGTQYAAAYENTIQSNTISRCIRKGLDVHVGYDNKFRFNHVEDCWVGGMFSVWTSANQPAIATEFYKNTIVRCGWRSGDPTTSQGGVYIGGLAAAIPSESRSKLIENTFIECWGSTGIILTRYVDDVEISKNRIIGIHPEGSTLSYGMMIGNFLTGNAGNSTKLIVNGNNVNVPCTIGIQINKTTGSASDNVTKGSTGVGVYYNGGAGAFEFNFYRNLAIVDAGQGVTISQTKGETVDNSAIISGSATLGSNRSAYFNAPSISRSVSFYLTFNGTTTPLIENITGGAVVQSATTSATGVDFVLSGIEPTAKVDMIPTPISANSPATATPAYAQYLYSRSSGYASASLGIKTSGAATGHISGDTLVSGKIRINLMIF